MRLWHKTFKQMFFEKCFELELFVGRHFEMYFLHERLFPSRHTTFIRLLWLCPNIAFLTQPSLFQYPGSDFLSYGLMKTNAQFAQMQLSLRSLLRALVSHLVSRKDERIWTSDLMFRICPHTRLALSEIGPETEEWTHTGVVFLLIPDFVLNVAVRLGCSHCLPCTRHSSSTKSVSVSFIDGHSCQTWAYTFDQHAKCKRPAFKICR